MNSKEIKTSQVKTLRKEQLRFAWRICEGQLYRMIEDDSETSLVD